MLGCGPGASDMRHTTIMERCRQHICKHAVAASNMMRGSKRQRPQSPLKHVYAKNTLSEHVHHHAMSVSTTMPSSCTHDGRFHDTML
jgi:hypothetical protein